jgi:YD repeat-containing protein
MSPAGVAYGSGGVSPRAPTLLQSNGFGTVPLGVDLGWSNLGGYNGAGPGSPFGAGMVNPDLPWLEQGTSGGLTAVEDAGNAISFTYNSSTSTYSPQFFSQDTLASDGSGGYLLTQSNGTVIDYYGFGSGVPIAQQGKLEDYTEASGDLTTTTYNSSGQMTAVQRTDGTTTESYAYTYISSGINTGLVSNVTLMSGPAGGTLSTVQQVAFAYYDGTQSYGNARELQTETLEDASGNALGTTYYRY